MLTRWSVAMMARTRLFFIAAFCFTIFLYKPHCKKTHRNQIQQILLKETPEDIKYQALLQEYEEQNHHYTSSLRKQIFHLKHALREKRRRQMSVQPPAFLQPVTSDQSRKRTIELEAFLRKQLHDINGHDGVSTANEHAVVPSETFTLNSIYQLQTGLKREPVRKTLRKDVAGALESALHILNGPKDKDDPQHRKIYSPRDFFEGIFHCDRDKGTLYDLTFGDNTSLDFRRLVLFRPFALLQNVKEETVDTSRMLINIIVPLTAQIDTFRQFMNNFRDASVEDGRIHLTVVTFGTEKINEVRRIVDAAARSLNPRNFTLMHLNEKFSRGHALNMGARAWRKGNILLFFCDVDVRFTVGFLNSCRINTKAGKRVFYPIPFIQNNPDIINDQIPILEKYQVIHKNTKFWKDFSFGASCQYLSDFINIGGFAVSIKFWGKEDVYLYRKYLHSNLMVVRAPSRDLFQVWEKTSLLVQ